MPGHWQFFVLVLVGLVLVQLIVLVPWAQSFLHRESVTLILFIFSCICNYYIAPFDHMLYACYCGIIPVCSLFFLFFLHHFILYSSAITYMINKTDRQQPGIDNTSRCQGMHTIMHGAAINLSLRKKSGSTISVAQFWNSANFNWHPEQ